MSIFDSYTAKPETPFMDFRCRSQFRMRVIGGYDKDSFQYGPGFCASDSFCFCCVFGTYNLHLADYVNRHIHISEPQHEKTCLCHM